MQHSAEIAVVERVDPSAGPEMPALTPAQLELRTMVLNSVTSLHSRRTYAKGLDLLFAFAANRPLTRALLMEYRTSMEDLAPSTVNVRLAAVRKMVTEAKRNGLLSAEEAASLTDVPNVRQSGTRLGNWLSKEQARELLAVPDRSTVKGKRDYAILAVLVGCALRRRETGAKLKEVRPPGEDDPLEQVKRKDRDPTAKAPPGGMLLADGTWKGNAVPIGDVVGFLTGMSGADRIVVDETKLQGFYDFQLHIVRDGDGPSVADQIEGQLGLKLESRKKPVKTYVIEAADKPSVDGE